MWWENRQINKEHKKKELSKKNYAPRFQPTMWSSELFDEHSSMTDTWDWIGVKSVYMCVCMCVYLCIKLSMKASVKKKEKGKLEKGRRTHFKM